MSVRCIKSCFAFVLCFVLVNTTAIAAPAFEKNTGVFDVMAKLNQLPVGAAPILPCGLDEKKRVVDMLRGKDDPDLTMSPDGVVSDQWHDTIEIYKGDFSNQGAVEYALVTTGGDMNMNTVTVYKLAGNQLVDAKLDDIIVANRIPGGDMSRFYSWVGNPFAMIQKGKVYLRYEQYQWAAADPNKIKPMLCTYFWQKNKFAATDPNLNKPQKNPGLSATQRCM
jgi:hypothetical protein